MKLLSLLTLFFMASFLFAPGISFGLGSKPQKTVSSLPRKHESSSRKPKQTQIPPQSPKTPQKPSNPTLPPKQEPIRGVVGEIYRRRYVLPTASMKLVDNHGNGDSRLYGVRNFRSVLNGVFYRGGANNYFNRHGKRSNMNPLPAEGLEHLCEEGFGDSIYLYSQNYRAARRSTHCRTFQGNENTLNYSQISPLDFKGNSLSQILDLIYQHIRNPRLGPIYTHCWNGWHASGYVAATALRQFCGFTADQAVRYWNLNTDGNDGRSYNGIRAKIRSFQPRRELSLSQSERNALCPLAPNLAYRP